MWTVWEFSVVPERPGQQNDTMVRGTPTRAANSAWLSPAFSRADRNNSAASPSPSRQARSYAATHRTTSSRLVISATYPF